MDNQDIKLLLIKKLKLQKAYVTGDSNHIKILVIGDIFKGISQVKRQQIVYTPLINMITQKHIHSVSIMSYTIEEWKIKNKNMDHSEYA
ncbi:BolA/IbaG family iron-sulfur metabolism protein [Buchnera aphidicola]|uniref:BolA/IbaG family iron-sulfur metabolism protein n=1 Tax=Buchnera aphidicola TaxID=9 RepID=UPI003463A611